LLNLCFDVPVPFCNDLVGVQTVRHGSKDKQPL
jgi:hypothetical protein